VTRALAIALAFTACAPFQRLALKRCPTTMASLGDFTIATVALGAATLAYNADRHARAIAYAGLGMSVALGSNASECRR
jgi:hypothetical protein